MPILEYTNGVRTQGRGSYHRIMAFDECYHAEVMAFLNSLERKIQRQGKSPKHMLIKKDAGNVHGEGINTDADIGDEP